MKGLAFTAEMAQAIYDGRKTQTRRVIEPQPNSDIVGFVSLGNEWLPQIIIADTGEIETRGEVQKRIKSPYDRGERIYVQEPCVVDKSIVREEWLANGGNPWEPRTTIEITAIRVERLQDITEADAKAEGMPEYLENDINHHLYCSYCKGRGLVGSVGASLGFREVTCSECDTRAKMFKNIWYGLYKNHSIKGWDANPWVWVYTFKKVKL